MADCKSVAVRLSRFKSYPTHNIKLAIGVKVAHQVLVLREGERYLHGQQNDPLAHVGRALHLSQSKLYKS